MSPKTPTTPAKLAAIAPVARGATAPAFELVEAATEPLEVGDPAAPADPVLLGVVPVVFPAVVVPVPAGAAAPFVQTNGDPV